MTPTGRPDTWRLGALALAMLLPSLGTSIANVTLPTLAATFATGQSGVQWVVIAYLLAVTTLIVGAGRLGDMVGRRRLLLIGITGFAAASIGCALAPTLWLLVAARGAQGAGAAVLMSLTVASVNDVVPPGRTGSAMGLLGTVSAVGTALGPSVGGALVAARGWPAVFVFMAGAGLVTLVAGWLLLPADRPHGRRPASFDLGGMLLLGVSVGAAALLATAAVGPMSLVFGTAAVGGLAGFVMRERRTHAPLVDLALLQDARLRTGLAQMGLVSTIVMATLVVGPFYLAKVLELDPVLTGLVMSVGPGVAALTGWPAGRLVDRFGPVRISLGGLCGVAVGSVTMTLLPGALGLSGYVAALAIITAGYALFQAANMTAVMSAAAGERRGLVSALLGLSRNLGLIAGASAMGTIFALAQGPTGAAGGGAGLVATFTTASLVAALAIGTGLRRR